MKINLDTPGEEARIEIIPLIDVIFCILTFFLLASLQLTRQQAISVDLPQASTGAAQMRDMLIVSLDDFGQVYVEQQQITSKDQLNQALLSYTQTNPNGLMVLYASKSATYNQVVQVLDLLREVGGTKVSLATLPSSSENSSGSNTQVPKDSSVPSTTPSSGNLPTTPSNPDPYNLNPAPSYNPLQPQLPTTPSQPQVPGQYGIYPTNPGLTPLSPSSPNSPQQ